MSQNIMKRALISVYDKTGVVEFAKTLADAGIEILSTGGTFSLLKENGVPVTKVSDVTDFPEILGGRVKTLHPRIHGGILAKRDDEPQMQELLEHEIGEIDMVVVNLYPFEKTVADPDVDLKTALENIDIGGPCMIRAAAKNFISVAVVTDPSHYALIQAELKVGDAQLSDELRQKLALAAFQRTARYDQAISAYLGGLQEDVSSFTENMTLQLKKVQDLRYGENPHQRAAFYADASLAPRGAVAAKQLHGKALSYNNIMDMNAAIGMALEFDEPAVAIIKHSNPCGASVAADVATAYERALSCDPISAFGGIVATNKEVTPEAAEKISNVFTEVVIAPAFSRGALDILMQKKNIRLIEWPTDKPMTSGFEVKAVDGGFLLQDVDLDPDNEADFKVVTKRQPTDAEYNAMRFGWKIAKWVKSNAVIYVNDTQTLGIGAGQMSRVDSSEIAVIKAAKAGLDLKGSVVISDAFFPFRDGVDAAAQAGAAAVIEPGGSIRDEEVIAAADEHNMAMVFTGKRHFRH